MSKIASPKRGVIVTHEAIRQWCLMFGLDYARRLRRRRGVREIAGIRSEDPRDTFLFWVSGGLQRRTHEEHYHD